MSLELAIRHALKNPIKSRGRTSISRFGVILTDGYNTFKGWNSYKTHPLQAKYAREMGTPEKIHIHAEISALTKALRFLWPREFKSYDMYIARVLASGEPANSCPCEGCMAAIAEFGIRHVEWTE